MKYKYFICFLKVEHTACDLKSSWTFRGNKSGKLDVKVFICHGWEASWVIKYSV